ncbi:DUF3558 domain-containing protein [Actinokineospora xionganensis]|uniref:DUF3558 domain-containing protein n=1 Tax=Actinokineospora xionganensis TaxID=2684470 RepID=A0ABR7L9N8_9PSEU|nr:DUF3558 domain-containing protein [Actinokineospora xionganensis]MBC6449104.1 DUF3558 domain-containing protein [Actinokineospora xionganensis]
MRTRCLLAIATIFIGISGCASPEPGTPIASNPPSETSSATAKPTKSTDPAPDLPSHGAPKVKSPLKTDKFEADPCAVFTDEQLGKYGVGTGTADSDKLGKSCTWKTEDSGTILLAWDNLFGRGISRIYQGQENGKYAFFDVLPDIEGFPAVSYGARDNRPMGICSVSIGVSDQVSLMVTLAQSTSKQGTAHPCEVAARVAADAVTSMKAGA